MACERLGSVRIGGADGRGRSLRAAEGLRTRWSMSVRALSARITPIAAGEVGGERAPRLGAGARTARSS